MSESAKDRLLDTLVYGPLGLALYARDAAPGFLRIFVARGRHEFDRHKDNVADQFNEGVETAMTVGQQAMASAPEVRRRVEGGVETARDLVGGVVSNLREGTAQVAPNGAGKDSPQRSATTPPAAAPAPTQATPTPPAPTQAPPKQARPAQSSRTSVTGSSTTPSSTTGSSTTRSSTTPSSTTPSSTTQAPTTPSPRTGPSTADDTTSSDTSEPPTEPLTGSAAEASGGALPIPDYDELAASQVVERLEGLEPSELEAVASYERSRRGRRTILGKIEQLTA